MKLFREEVHAAQAAQRLVCVRVHRPLSFTLGTDHGQICRFKREIVLKKYVKVLASTGLVGLHAVSGLSGLAVAQTALTPVTITGSANGGSACWPNCTAYGYSGGSSSGSSSSIPENEAVGLSAPPPKTAEQKAAAVAVCEAARTDQRADLQFTYTANMGVCAAGNSNPFGYAYQQLLIFLGQSTGTAPASCAVKLTLQYNEVANIIDARRNACVAAANQG